MTDKKPTVDSQPISVLLQLEADARQAEDLLALQYFIVNETRRLIQYRHAILFQSARHKGSGFHAVRASGLTQIDRTTPKMQWLERVVNELSANNSSDQTLAVDYKQLPTDLQQDWRTFSLAHPVWVPLMLPDGMAIGGLWLEKETPWNGNEVFLIKRLADTFAHAWGYFDRHRLWKAKFTSSKVAWVAGALLLAVLLFPVQQSTLAPAIVVAKDPLVVSAPIDGVIASISVDPNQMVKQGTTLLSYEDTNYRNKYTVTEQSLAVALAELRKARQSAFLDPKSKADVALLQAKVDLAMAERDYAKEKLEQVNIHAERDGLLLYNDKSDLIGRPVKTGERLMEIATPKQLMMRINLPVANAIEFSSGTDVKVFLDADPMHSIDAKVTYANFRAEVLPGDLLAYRVEAEITEPVDHLRIGWQGTAKIYGESVSLFYYLFRRPLSTARQFIGW